MNRITLQALAMAALMCAPSYTSAQDGEKKGRENLVDNGDFAEFEGSLRRKEQFELAKGWVNPTESKSELYATDVKSRYIAIPDNMYGTQEPATGDNYAGLTAYSYRNKMPRSYIQAELKQSLNERGLYCIKFKASLAERSRYASNNLSVSIDKSKLSNKSTASLSASNPLYSEYNDVVDLRDGWWEFCTLYRAAGKEKYITIGNFQSDDRTKTVQMDLPEKYAEDGPIMAAYYFIDDVRVEPIEVGESCNCASDRIPESKVIFSGSVQLNDEMSLKEKIEAIDAYFYQYQAEVVSAAERTIDQIVALLKAEPTAKVTIIGHSDNEEAELAETEATLMGLASRRANQVRSYMMDQGIAEDRLSVKSMDNRAPVAKMATPISLAKNRRVEFELK